MRYMYIYSGIYIYIVEYYSAIKKNDILPFATTWMDLEGTILFFFFLSFCLFVFSKAASTAYGGSQARGLIRAVAVSLCQSHSNSRSEPCLQPTPQLTATL